MSGLRNFHAGEVQLQRESNVDAEAFDAAVEQPFQPELNDSETRFIGKRTFSVAASLDVDGRPWASPLLGVAGELLVVQDETTVLVKPQDADGDPLFDNVRATGEMGILYFDPSLRRRAKSLGRGTVEPNGSITYRMHRMFGICPKYIFKRSHEFDGARVENPDAANSAAKGAAAQQLSADDQAQLGASDTIFLASHSTHGTDPTHRGGPQGFVKVVDDKTVSIPDYLGNGMFQTLGNILLDDHIGLLSVDFETGRSLHVTGRGSIHASDEDDIYSERTLMIEIDEVRTSWPQIGIWTDIEAFELRPGLYNPGTPRVKDGSGRGEFA